MPNIVEFGLHQYYISLFIATFTTTIECQMKKLLIILSLPLSAFCQNTIGIPEIVNFSKQEYKAGLQSWDFTQDKNGVIYAANNEGLLSYDGRNWRLYPLPNKTIVRSVAIGPDAMIYVGGQDEIGYFSPDKNGRLQYHSMVGLIAPKDRSFGDVWDIVPYQNEIYFRSATKIFKCSHETALAFKAPLEWSYLGICNGQLYAHDYQSGLLRFENDVWMPATEKNELPAKAGITGIVKAGNESALITTLKNGLYLMSGQGIHSLNSANNQLFQNERVYAATTVDEHSIALATNNGGVYITDLSGNIIQRFSKREGLQNNNVLSIFLDSQKNLWLGLDNGIDLVEYNSAIKQINPLLQDGSGYTAIVHNQQLYLGTSTGLYRVPLQSVEDLSFSKGDFSLVSNSQGQTWGLASINNQLLLGHHDGAFVVNGNTAKPISSVAGFWNFLPLSSTFPTPQIVAGNYKGLYYFDCINQQFVQSGVLPGFVESSRFVAIDRYENIWVSHPYHGVYRIARKGGEKQVELYTNKNGLPSALNNHVYKIRSEVVVATENGVYLYNEKADRFEPSPLYEKLLGNQSIRYLKEDLSGNIWFIHEKTLGVIDFSGKEPTVIYLPELRNKMLSGFECIYPVDAKNIFLGGEKGFYLINYDKYKKTNPKMQVQVRLVRIINKTDSLLFGGYFKNVNEPQLQEKESIQKLSYDWKTIHLEYSSTLFSHQANIEYSYRLRGFDDNWSEWSARAEKEFNNLHAGHYTFEVKARTNLGSESEVSAYSFVILPPWYQTIWTNVVYLLLFAGGLYLLYRWQKKKFELQQAKYEEEQKRLIYIHELELNKAESELVTLRNEKLEAEINFKNSELASSAMHLFKKGELLTKVKTGIAQVMKQLDNQHAIAELKKMVKTLSEDDNMDKEWENFSRHFDKVHSDFVTSLKEKHPTITGNELKLSAYLRMNLSTKEIAQLMNISVRGVEISRYRLRKKLGIGSDVSLFDYLINLSNENKAE